MQRGYGGPSQYPRHGGGPRRGPQALPRLILWLILLALVAGIVMFVVNGMQQRKVQQLWEPYADVFGPEIYINDIAIAGMKPDEALQKLIAQQQQAMNSWSMALEFRGHRYITLGYHHLGLSVPEDGLKRLLNEAWMLTHRGSIADKVQAIDSLRVNPYKRSLDKADFNDSKLREFLVQIAQNINRPATDARLLDFTPNNQQNPFQFQAEQSGLELDINQALTEILQKAANGESGVYQLQPTESAAKVTLAELKKDFMLLGSATTDVASSSIENRNNNIRLSFEKINGVILKPGEVFSFNRVVGQRTLRNGFYEAPEYVSGDLVTGVGGGVCQTSTTVYQAALMSNLQIVDRRPHSDPVNYTDPGLDATVYWEGKRQIDFKFKNSTEKDIYLTASVQANRKNPAKLQSVTIKMYGRPVNPDISYRLTSAVVEWIPNAEAPIRKQDKYAEVVTYTDEEKVYSKARDGMVVVTNLETLYQGNVIDRKQISKDTYPPRPETVYVGITPR